MSNTRLAAFDLIATFCFMSLRDYYLGGLSLIWTDLQISPPIPFLLFIYCLFLFYLLDWSCEFRILSFLINLNNLFGIKRCLQKFIKTILELLYTSILRFVFEECLNWLYNFYNFLLLSFTYKFIYSKF